MERIKVSLNMTPVMHRDSRAAAKRDDRTLADWIRHCIVYGLRNPDDITQVRYDAGYEVLPRGRPTTL